MTKEEIFKKLQELGYRGKAVYIPFRHPDDPLSKGRHKKAAILAAYEKGLKKTEIARQLSTSLSYVTAVISNSKKEKTDGKKKSAIPFWLYREVLQAFPHLRRGGGLLYVPFTLKTDRHRRGISEALKFELLNSDSDIDCRTLAEKYGTSYAYVLKVRHELKKKGLL